MLSKIRDNKGYTLAELMTVVAVIAVILGIAIPGFTSYRDKAKVSSSTTTAETIRAAIAHASYMIDSIGNDFPASDDITDWESLVAVCNPNGATLRDTSAGHGMLFISYDLLDSDSDGVDDDYSLIFEVTGVKNNNTGKIIEVHPNEILKRAKV